MSYRRGRTDASYHRSGPAPTRFPPRSRPPNRSSVKATLSNLALSKTAEYNRRKQEIINFTQKVMKHRIKGMLKTHIRNNTDTIFDFITQLNYHPSIENACVIEEIPFYSDKPPVIRCLVDVKLPKTALPTDTRNPLPPEILTRLRHDIVENIMQFAEPSTSSARNLTKRRIIIDIHIDNLFKVMHIKMPQDVYFGESVEYYSTFRDAHLGIRSRDTGLERIHLMEMGVKDDVILAILENLNGKNFCNTPSFRNICKEIRADLNQRTDELEPYVVFPQPREFGPELENANPMVQGRVETNVNVVQLLPILLTHLNLYSHEMRSSATEREIYSGLITRIETLTKILPRGNYLPHDIEYGIKRIIKAGVTTHSLYDTLLYVLFHDSNYVPIFDAFLASPHALNVYKFISASSIDREIPDKILKSLKTVKALIKEFTSARRLSVRRIRLYNLETPWQFVTLYYNIPTTHATPVIIPESDVLNIPPINSSAIPPGEITAEVIHDAGIIKSRKRKHRHTRSKRRKSNRRKSNRRKSKTRKSNRRKY